MMMMMMRRRRRREAVGVRQRENQRQTVRQTQRDRSIPTVTKNGLKQEAGTTLKFRSINHRCTVVTRQADRENTELHSLACHALDTDLQKHMHLTQ